MKHLHTVMVIVGSTLSIAPVFAADMSTSSGRTAQTSQPSLDTQQCEKMGRICGGQQAGTTTYYATTYYPPSYRAPRATSVNGDPNSMVNDSEARTWDIGRLDSSQNKNDRKAYGAGAGEGVLDLKKGWMWWY